MSKLVTKVLSFLKRAYDKIYPVHIEGSQVCSFSFFLLKAFWCKFLPSIFSFAETEKKHPGQLFLVSNYIDEKLQSAESWFVCRCVLVVSATSCMDHYANTFRLRYATPPEKANGVILGKNFAEHFLRSGGGKRAMKNDTIPQQLGLGHVSVKDWRDLSSAFPIPTTPQ